MAAYLVARVEITNPDAYENYKKLAAQAIAKHDGRYLARGGHMETLEGDEESRQAEELTWPIQFLNKRFRCAVDEHLSRLKEMEQKGELDQMVAHRCDELRIDKELIREIGKQINGVAR